MSDPNTSRASPDTNGSGGFLVLREKDIKVPILDVVTCVLLLADFLLDIDVVLTKIEEIPNTYIGHLATRSGGDHTDSHRHACVCIHDVYVYICVYIYIWIYIYIYT